jgi:hypothetical protein
MTMQIGWLMGYYGHLGRKFPTFYLEYGVPCTQLYIDYAHKFLKVMKLKQKKG